MESIICERMALEMKRPVAIWGRAGATIVEATGEMKVWRDNCS